MARKVVLAGACRTAIGKMGGQLCVWHPETVVMIRKRSMIGKTQNGNPGFQRAADIVFLSPLRVAAALAMGVVICFHGSLFLKAKQISICFAPPVSIIAHTHGIYQDFFSHFFYLLS